jgi:hypothetical protein
VTCPSKIRPLPNPTEIRCEKPENHRYEHRGVLRDYAKPGSVTTVTWQQNDRRAFIGEWAPCDSTGCVLPRFHPGDHAV